MARSPPGPTGEPLVGSSRRYAKDPFRFVAAVESAYGDVARFDLGPLDTYMIADPAAIERVLVSEADRFRKPEFRDGPIGDVLGDGLLMSEGETWERQRALAGPAFRASRLSGMSDRIVEHAERTIDAWQPGDVVDVESETTRITLDVILDLMMGVELPEPRVRSIQRQLEPLGRRFEPDPIRFALPEWVPLPGDAAFARALDELEEILDEIVARRHREVAADGSAAGSEGVGRPGGVDGASEEPPMDFLSILLRARERGDQSTRQLRDEMMTILLAGHDTTALVLTYTWYLLSEHPDVRRRVHAEVDDVVGDDRPGAEHVRELDYVERVLQEAMRLYPPVYALFRSPTSPVELAGYTVPEDATLMLPQWGVHRSDRFWDGPETFDPDRWTPERNAERPQFAYFPFGGGPRHCIGKQLAMLEAKLVVAATARRYRLEYVGETPLELFPSLTAHPQNEMRMRVEPR